MAPSPVPTTVPTEMFFNVVGNAILKGATLYECLDTKETLRAVIGDISQAGIDPVRVTCVEGQDVTLISTRRKLRLVVDRNLQEVYKAEFDPLLCKNDDETAKSLKGTCDPKKANCFILKYEIKFATRQLAQITAEFMQFVQPQALTVALKSDSKQYGTFEIYKAAQFCTPYENIVKESGPDGYPNTDSPAVAPLFEE